MRSISYVEQKNMTLCYRKYQKSVSFALIQGKARPHEQTRIKELSPKLK